MSGGSYLDGNPTARMEHRCTVCSEEGLNMADNGMDAMGGLVEVAGDGRAFQFSKFEFGSTPYIRELMRWARPTHFKASLVWVLAQSPDRFGCSVRWALVMKK